MCCLCVSELMDDANNPFDANGELSRKADFIVTHSCISRTRLQIVDPDEDNTANSSSSSSRGSDEAVDSTDGPTSQPSHLHRDTRHDDDTTVVTVTSGVTTPLNTSTAEKIVIKKKRCVVQ